MRDYIERERCAVTPWDVSVQQAWDVFHLVSGSIGVLAALVAAFFVVRALVADIRVSTKGLKP